MHQEKLDLNFEEYIELGNSIKKVRELAYKIKWQIPKKRPINRNHEKALKAIDEAKSALEELMFFAFPERSTTHIFYGSRSKTYAVYDGDDPTPDIPFAVSIDDDGRVHCECALPKPCRHENLALAVWSNKK